MQFIEKEKTDTQLTIYAATKKANESMAHSYSYLWKIPTTMFRFFTVYGPWGRPDMALFKFVSAIINNKPIDIYNKGEMSRDFTYVDDLVRSIYLLINKTPYNSDNSENLSKDNVSPVAPFRVLNIGNTKKISLLNFINSLEKELKIKAKKKYLPMQKGDVISTLSDSKLLKKITGYNPKTDYRKGIKEFVSWYLRYYKKN